MFSLFVLFVCVWINIGDGWCDNVCYVLFKYIIEKVCESPRSKPTSEQRQLQYSEWLAWLCIVWMSVHAWALIEGHLINWKALNDKGQLNDQTVMLSHAPESNWQWMINDYNMSIGHFIFSFILYYGLWYV